ncbi:RDD family protein [Micromonospora thermarum]|uniref:RDD family protein n=1 Tax=Micromonospora thermarum TaxID=2720024 RepID=A0ABX0ZEM4_9ACTN|nr:RDD family protein [Micromonospora thermarum]NJP35679.1 RDD family protein [Micromonospora thermarum]
MSVAPGWYVDPADPETRRYWDGEGWIGAPIPVDATPPEGPPPAEPPAAAPAPPGPVSPAAGHPPAAGPAPAPPSPTGPAPHPGGWPPHAAPPQGYGPPPGWPYPTWPGRPPEPRPHGLPLAGYGARLVARLIDFAVVFALNAVVNGWFVWRYIQEISPSVEEAWSRIVSQERTTEPLPPAGDQASGLQIAILLIATALWLAYEVPSTASRGQTFGKRVMGVKVVPVSADAPLGFGRALRRWNTLGLPTLLWFCCIGFLLQLVDAVSPLFDHPMRQALHDKRAQTVVVQLPRTPAPKNDRTTPPGDTP